MARRAGREPSPRFRIAVIGSAIGAQYLIATAMSLVIVNHAIGVGAGIGALVVIAGQVPSLIVPTVAGWISDRYGRRTTLAVGTACAVVTALGWIVGRSDPVLLAWVSFGIGCSTSIWGSAGVAALIDATSHMEERGQEHAAVVLGWVIDVGKLIGSAAIALIAVAHGLGAYSIIVLACAAEYVGMRASQKRVKPAPVTKGEVASTQHSRPPLGIPEISILAGFGIIGLAGSQQSSITVFAASSSHDGLAAAGIAWAVGALLGTGALLLAKRLQPWHLWCTPVIFMCGMVGIGWGRFPAILGIGVVGFGAAVLWQAYRGMVLTRVPASFRGTYGGMVLTVATLAQSIGASLLIGLIPHFGIRNVCDVLGYSCLAGLIPLGYGAQQLAKRARSSTQDGESGTPLVATEDGAVIPLEGG